MIRTNPKKHCLHYLLVINASSSLISPIKEKHLTDKLFVSTPEMLVSVPDSILW